MRGRMIRLVPHRVWLATARDGTEDHLSGMQTEEVGRIQCNGVLCCAVVFRDLVPDMYVAYSENHTPIAVAVFAHEASFLDWH